MTTPKKWSPGIIDEPWKLMIVARDLNRAEDAVAWLISRLTNTGTNEVAGLDQIASMTGAEIVASLRDALAARDHIRALFVSAKNVEDQKSK